MATVSLLNADVTESLGISGVGFFVLFALMLYRFLLKQPTIQEKIHRLGPGALLLQWWVLFLATLGVVLVISFFDVVVTYNEMNDAAIAKNAKLLASAQEADAIAMQGVAARALQEVATNMQVEQEALQFEQSTTTLAWAEPTTTPVVLIETTNNASTVVFVEELFEKLKIPLWYARLNVVAVMLAIPAYLLVCWHCWMIAQKGRQIALQIDNRDDIRPELPWMPSQATNTALHVLIMPAVMSTWGLRAAPKIWNLAYGAAHSNKEGETWEHWRDVQLGAYRGDMELASAFQYFAVLSFARLCNRYINDSEVLNAWNSSPAARRLPDEEREDTVEDMKRGLAVPLFLGVYAFCTVGLIRCLFNMMCFNVMGEYKVFAYQVNASLLGNVDTIMGFATILCVINMAFICKMKEIILHQGNATLKFLGMRILLIIGQMQMQIILAFQKGSPMFEKVEKIKRIVDETFEHTFNAEFFLTKIELSEYEAHLLHVSLLITECLVVVLLNLALWGWTVEEADLKMPCHDVYDVQETVSYEVAEPTMWEKFFCCRGNGPTPLNQAYARVSNNTYPVIASNAQSRDLTLPAVGTRPWQPLA